MYHLLKGFYEYFTRSVRCLMSYYLLLMCCRKEEFSVIILDLDGAGKTVCIRASRMGAPLLMEAEDAIGEDQDALQ